MVNRMKETVLSWGLEGSELYKRRKNASGQRNNMSKGAKAKNDLTVPIPGRQEWTRMLGNWKDFKSRKSFKFL